MLTPQIATFIANEAIPAGARVKFVSGSTVKVQLAGIADTEIGTAILHSGQSSAAADTGVAVKLNGSPGSRTFNALDAITAGNPIYRAASGQVSASGPGEQVGIALESSTTSGDFIEGLNHRDLALSGTADGLGGLRVARATYDVSTTLALGTVGAHGLGVTLPIKAVVVGGFLQVNTAFTSGGSGTLALKVESANDIISAAAVSGAPFSTTGQKAIIPKANTPESTGVALTAAREITATVATADLTAGKGTLFLYYVIGA